MPVSRPSHDTTASSTEPHGELMRLTPRGVSRAEFIAYLLAVLLVLVLVFDVFAATFIKKILGLQAAAAAGLFTPPPPSVTTYVVKGSQWQPSLHAIGSTEAVQGTNISADLPGIVKEIAFQSGQTVKKGDILVRLVTDQEEAQLQASQAQRDLAVYTPQTAEGFAGQERQLPE